MWCVYVHLDHTFLEIEQTVVVRDLSLKILLCAFFVAQFIYCENNFLKFEYLNSFALVYTHSVVTYG